MAAENCEDRQAFWLAQAAMVRRRVNLGWWVEAVSAPLLGFSLTGAAVLLWLRREMPGLSLPLAAAAIAALLVGIGVVCLLVARRRFETTEVALVRIEAAMKMRNRLSAATAGVAPWPESVKRVDAGLHWRRARVWVPLAGSLALLVAGLWIPVAAKGGPAGGGAGQPQAWGQLEAELDLLAKEQVVDETYLEETRRRLEELKAQEEEDWFSHSSLEATDSLRKSHQTETGRVEREMGRAEKALAGLEKAGGARNQAENERMIEDFEQALQGLRNGTMKPDPQLLEQMQGLDLKNLGNLPPEQLRQLKENLARHSGCLGQCQGEGNPWDEELMAGGEREGECDQPGKGPGQGGVARGPGHAPGVLGQQRDGLETGKLEGLAAKDLSQAAPGDLLGLEDGEHEVDRNASAVTAGGATTATGKGGDRVWRDSLDPDEQRALKRFFE